jgi:hypothetical protein
MAQWLRRRGGGNIKLATAPLLSIKLYLFIYFKLFFLPRQLLFIVGFVMPHRPIGTNEPFMGNLPPPPSPLPLQLSVKLALQDLHEVAGKWGRRCGGRD